MAKMSQGVSAKQELEDIRTETSGKLWLRSSPDTAERFLQLPISPAEKYKWLDLTRLITANAKSHDWGQKLLSVLDRLYNCGADLLKPSEQRSANWRTFRYEDSEGKVDIRSIKGIQDILGMMGYTIEGKSGFSLHHLRPKDVQDIAGTSAELYLATAELDSFLRGSHSWQYELSMLVQPAFRPKPLFATNKQLSASHFSEENEGSVRDDNDYLSKMFQHQFSTTETIGVLPEEEVRCELCQAVNINDTELCASCAGPLRCPIKKPAKLQNNPGQNDRTAERECLACTFMNPVTTNTCLMCYHSITGETTFKESAFRVKDNEIKPKNKTLSGEESGIMVRDIRKSGWGPEELEHIRTETSAKLWVGIPPDTKNRFIQLPISLKDKYRNIDFIRLIKENAKSHDWGQRLLRALDRIYQCGVDVLKPRDDRLPTWRKFEYKDPKDATDIRTMKGTNEILSQIGFTREREQIFVYCEMKPDARNDIIEVSAELYFAKAELECYLRGEHSREDEFSALVGQEFRPVAASKTVRESTAALHYDYLHKPLPENTEILHDPSRSDGIKNQEKICGGRQCSACTYFNHVTTDICEMCNTSLLGNEFPMTVDTQTRNNNSDAEGAVGIIGEADHYDLTKNTPGQVWRSDSKKVVGTTGEDEIYELTSSKKLPGQYPKKLSKVSITLKIDDVCDYFPKEKSRCRKCESECQPKLGLFEERRCATSDHSFCDACSKPFQKNCRRNRHCPKGPHCHHPRDCVFYLRNFKQKTLKKLLSSHELDFKEYADWVKIEAKRRKCSEKVIEAETSSESKNWLCKPYTEYLISIINKHNVDPVLIMNPEQLKSIIRRELDIEVRGNKGRALLEFVQKNCPMR